MAQRVAIRGPRSQHVPIQTGGSVKLTLVIFHLLEPLTWKALGFSESAVQPWTPRVT